jgi:hypothetical protein
MTQANPVKFTARPFMQGNKVKWELCHTNPPNSTTPVCGTSNGAYPKVTLDVNTSPYNFRYEIVNDQTGKGIKFADGGLVIKKGEPFGPGKEKQIGDVQGGGNKVLTFVDLNSLPSKADPAPVTITYGLHFTDQNGVPVTSIDPDITNGGTNNLASEASVQFDFLDPTAPEFWALGGLILVATFVALTIAKMLKYWG